jgi:excinuclease ABC subunit C
MFDTEKIKKIATQPGVYLMKNRRGTVLYIGKAKKLRQRVRQYFSKNADGRFMVPFLIAQVHAIETILVSSEKEALLLENNLIKKYQPKYNVLLKDDKTYIALQVNHKHPWPMVKIVRYRGQPKSGALYFGPYTSAGAARKTLDLINKVFPLRQCSDRELKSRTRPCILHGMKRCSAPCVGLCTKVEYGQFVDQAIQFLKGQNKELVRDLKVLMQQYSDDLEFERAHDVLVTIGQIEKTIEKQYVDKPLGIDCDCLAIYREGDEVTLCQLLFKEGKMMGTRNFQFQQVVQEDDAIYLSFILQHYQDVEELPHEILLPQRCEGTAEASEILSEGKSRKLRVLSPTRGDKLSYVNLAVKNAEASFKKEKDETLIRERTLVELQEKLRLTRYPKRIECFDNSHTAGDEPVSSMVVFTDGTKDAKRYRKYKIKAQHDKADDYASMNEILTRRYKRAKLEDDLPDLIIVDGGKGHLNIARKVLADLDISTVDVIGVAKEKGRHDRGMTAEQVFIPNVKDPIILKHHSPILFLLQQIRDEAHRVAITFHRKRHSKKTIKSELDTIQGIGVKKRNALLKHFGSVKKIKGASHEDLMAVEGISQGNATMILSHLNR